VKAPTVLLALAGVLFATTAWAQDFDYGLSLAQLEAIGVPAVHGMGYAGEGMVVAVLDTGFDTHHEVFAALKAEGRISASRDFVQGDQDVGDGDEDPVGQAHHGTEVLSLLAARVEGMLVGAAPAASYLLAKTEMLDREEPIEEQHWLAAARWAAESGADVVVSSLNWPDFHPPGDVDGATAPSSLEILSLTEEFGVLFVLSAGNGGPSSGSIHVPADAIGALVVGASDDTASGVNRFSSRGPTADGRIKPDLLGPGEVLTADPTGPGTASREGTSVAAPLVGGLAVLLRQACPGASPAVVADALRRSSDQADAPDSDRGWGLPDGEVAYGLLRAEDCVPDGDDDDVADDDDSDDDDTTAPLPRESTGGCGSSVSSKAAPGGAALWLLCLCALRCRSRWSPRR
jgi:subtilisin family serine protease